MATKDVGLRIRVERGLRDRSRPDAETGDAIEDASPERGSVTGYTPHQSTSLVIAQHWAERQRRQDGAQAEAQSPPDQGSAPAPRRGREDARSRQDLRRQPQHDFEAGVMTAVHLQRIVAARNSARRAACRRLRWTFSKFWLAK
jgi:hypothetical protein